MSNLTVTVTVDKRSFEAIAKRLHLPGYKVSAKCPECGELVPMDLGIEYLQYPKANSAAPLYFQHERGNLLPHVWVEHVILTVSLKPAE